MVINILLLLTDRWCDWEAGYAIAVANSFSDYRVKTISLDTTPKVSMGGIKAEVDYSIDDYRNFDNLAMIILPGGLSWEENDYDETAAVEFAYQIFKALKIDSDEEIEQWYKNFKNGAIT